MPWLGTSVVNCPRVKQIKVINIHIVKDQRFVDERIAGNKNRNVGADEQDNEYPNQNNPEPVFPLHSGKLKMIS